MDFPHNAAGAGGSATPAKGDKIPLAPRRDAIAPTARDEGQPTMAIRVPTGLGNRIRPSEPKIPFERPLRTAVADGVGEMPPPAGKHGSHGMLAFFKSRRKGHHRIVTFILLPLAVLLTCAVLFVILKIL